MAPASVSRPMMCRVPAGIARGSAGRLFCKTSSSGCGPRRPRRGLRGLAIMAPHVLGPEPEGHPPVAELHGPPQRRAVRPPIHKRHPLLAGTRVEHHVGVRVVRAVVLGALGRTGTPAARTASSARAPRSSKGAPSRSNSSRSEPTPEPEDQPAAGHLVERAVALGDLEWVVVAEDEDIGGEADPGGDGGRGSRTWPGGPSSGCRGPRPRRSG